MSQEDHLSALEEKASPSGPLVRTRSLSCTPRFIDSYEWIEFQPVKQTCGKELMKEEIEEGFVSVSDLGVLCLSIDPNDEEEAARNSFRLETPQKEEKEVLLHKLFPKLPDPSSSQCPGNLVRTMSISMKILHGSPSKDVETIVEEDLSAPQFDQLHLPDVATIIEHTSSNDKEDSDSEEEKEDNTDAPLNRQLKKPNEQEVVEVPMAILMPQHRHQPVNRSRSFERRKAQGNWPPLSVTDRVPEVMLQPSELLVQHHPQQHLSPHDGKAKLET